jgi:hypothetical protein
MSHIRCMYLPGTHLQVGQDRVRTVQDSWDGLTCLTFGACTKEHLPKVGQDSEDSLEDGLTLYIQCMYHPRNTFTPKVGLETVEDLSRIVGDGTHMSHIRACTSQTHLHQRWARMVGTVQDSWGGLTCLTFGACTIQGHIYTKGGG